MRWGLLGRWKSKIKSCPTMKRRSGAIGFTRIFLPLASPAFSSVLGEGKIGAVFFGTLVVTSGDYAVQRVSEGDGENSGRVEAVEDGAVDDFPGLSAVRGVEDASGLAARAEPDVRVIRRS